MGGQTKQHGYQPTTTMASCSSGAVTFAVERGAAAPRLRLEQHEEDEEQVTQRVAEVGPDGGAARPPPRTHGDGGGAPPGQWQPGGHPPLPPPSSGRECGGEGIKNQTKLSETTAASRGAGSGRSLPLRPHDAGKTRSQEDDDDDDDDTTPRALA